MNVIMDGQLLFFFLRIVSNEKILNVDKANSKLFQFNFASFFLAVTGKLFHTRILYIR